MNKIFLVVLIIIFNSFSCNCMIQRQKSKATLSIATLEDNVYRQEAAAFVQYFKFKNIFPFDDFKVRLKNYLNFLNKNTSDFFVLLDKKNKSTLDVLKCDAIKSTLLQLLYPNGVGIFIENEFIENGGDYFINVMKDFAQKIELFIAFIIRRSYLVRSFVSFKEKFKEEQYLISQGICDLDDIYLKKLTSDETDYIRIMQAKKFAANLLKALRSY